MNRYASWLPVAVVLGVAAYLAAQAAPPKESGPMQIGEFGRLPVVYQGRLKPLDTLARNSLMVISDRQTFRDENGTAQPAIRWLLDVMTDQLGNDAARRHKVFRIENDEVLNTLGLEPRSGLRYAVDEFVDKMGVIEEQATRAQQVEDGSRTLYQRKIVQLAQQIQLFINLSRWEDPHLIPPSSEASEEWQRIKPVLAEIRRSGAVNPAVRSYVVLLSAYAEQDAEKFNTAVADYRRSLEPRFATAMQRGDLEVFFNRFEPFYHCSVLYVAAFLLACLAWLAAPQAFNRISFWVLVPTLAVHTFALGARMYLQGRPPVTNLYSSAIFIGWGCVVLALIMETLYANGIGNTMAGVMGFLSLLVAHHLTGDGDTLEMMQAVLDTNFWLATHVTCVTTGYAATSMAGVLGVLFILRGVFTRSLDPNSMTALGRMIDGIVCFAMLFSFTGTVLGGIWADQSWGRFWGWDPKENGALMIVIWNALILHARWGGLVQQRGMAVLAVLGNIITAWSWFGVNMLSVGLHSYGFMGSAVFWLVLFVVTQLILAGVGLLPVDLWRSFALLRPGPAPRPKRSPSMAGAAR